MYIKKLLMKNFKSFRDQQIEFSRGINYLVGNNNSGKSTVIQAIEFVGGTFTDASSFRTVSGDDNETSNEDKNGYVELTLADTNLASVIDVSTVDPKKAKTLKNECIYQGDDGEWYLTVRRSLAEPRRIQILDKEKQEFSNRTGIDAPFKALFSPTVFHATDTPDEVMDFGATKVLGKLITAKTSDLADTNEWNQFMDSYKKVFADDGKYAELLRDLNSSISDKTTQQFGPNIKVSITFDAPEQSLFGKMGRTVVDDGIETDLYQKGSGLQRAVAFAAIRVYAEQQKASANTDSDSQESVGTLPGPSLFLCVDEPEIWMHPKAQQALAQALADISQNEQVIVSTHSPYILQAFNRNVSGNSESLFIFNDDKTSDNRIMKSTDFGRVHPNRPSLAEITYEAFQIPTPEFHSELFGILHTNIKKLNVVHKGNDKCQVHLSNVSMVDRVLKSELLNLDEEDTHEYCRLDSRDRKFKDVWKGNPIASETLPVHIRNLTDHPEASAFLEEAKQYYRDHPMEDGSFYDFSQIENKYTDDQLSRSIEILLRALRRCKELQESGEWCWNCEIEGED